MYNKIQRSITVSVAAIALFFFLANTNFYPQLLTYQGGKPLADIQEVLLIQKIFISGKTHSALLIVFILRRTGKCIMIH